MTLLSKEQIQNLQKLYLEKKYSQLEFEIEAISNFNDRSAFLANLLGVSKLRNKFNQEKDFIANNENDYIQKSILLSKNYQKIFDLRKSLRAKALKSPLFDKDSFGNDFSNLTKNLWKSHNLNKKI